MYSKEFCHGTYLAQRCTRTRYWYTRGTGDSAPHKDMHFCLVMKHGIKLQLCM